MVKNQYSRNQVHIQFTQKRTSHKEKYRLVHCINKQIDGCISLASDVSRIIIIIITASGSRRPTKIILRYGKVCLASLYLALFVNGWVRSPSPTLLFILMDQKKSMHAVGNIKFSPRITDSDDSVHVSIVFTFCLQIDALTTQRNWKDLHCLHRQMRDRAR